MSKIDRRSFLRRLAAATAAATAVAATDLGLEHVDFDKLLWVPGEKKIFLPPAEGWKPAPIVIAEEIPATLRLAPLHPSRWAKVTMPDGKAHVIHHSVHTGMGYADFDVHGNLLRLGGRLITSAEEHARVEGQAYQHSQRNLMGGDDIRLHRIIQRRAAGGVYDAPSKSRAIRATFNWRG